MIQLAIILGANQEHPIQIVDTAVRLIEWNIGKVLKASRNYRTPPWGYESDNAYINKVIFIESDLQPVRIMRKLLNIEKILGRKREKQQGYEDRMIDLDILYIESKIIDTDVLVVPHPRLHLRKFCLVPLMDVDSEWLHPSLNKTVSQMLLECEDNSDVTIWENS